MISGITPTKSPYVSIRLRFDVQARPEMNKVNNPSTIVSPKISNIYFLFTAVNNSFNSKLRSQKVSGSCCINMVTSRLFQ